MNEAVITAANSITAVGHDGRLTAASARAGISRMFTCNDFLDRRDNPITVARIRGIDDEVIDAPLRLAGIATTCLSQLLDAYLTALRQRPRQAVLFLGVSAQGRPGPRYEEQCTRVLLRAMQKWTYAELKTVPQGNASMPFALAEAGRLLERSPGTLCIVGGIDSLLKDSTLNWFESDLRLKSRSYGRQHGLIAGEAVSFFVVEDSRRAEREGRRVLARISGVGVAEEPIPRVTKDPSRHSGLTRACRAALKGMETTSIHAVLGDLNGENSRAREWATAEMSCLLDGNQRKLWKPAECYGDIGAASGAVLVNIATEGFLRGWLPASALIFCSDDHGGCGAVILGRGAAHDAKEAGGCTEA